jgi:hypothetical protein
MYMASPASPSVTIASPSSNSITFKRLAIFFLSASVSERRSGTFCSMAAYSAILPPPSGPSGVSSDSPDPSCATNCNEAVSGRLARPETKAPKACKTVQRVCYSHALFALYAWV